MANANISCKVSNKFRNSMKGPAAPGAASPPAGGPPPAASPPAGGPVVEELFDFATIVDGPLTPGQEEWLKNKGAAAWVPVDAARKTELMAMATLGPLLKTAGLAAAGGRYNQKRNKRTKRNGNKGNKRNKRTRQNKRKNRNKKTNKRR